MRMHHLRGDIEHDAAYDLSLFHGLIEHNLLWETAVQQFYFCQTMHGFDAIFLLEVVAQYLPEGSVIVRTLDGDSAVLCPGYATTPDTFPPQAGIHTDIGCIVSDHDAGPALMEDGIQVFFGGETMIDRGDAFVFHPSDA